ncbi:fibroblast growth factor-binding protein 1 [Salminus brasiliensis]|uniref:fibroblast growth factor-binding protein 1 n=1 Tax=Salminus brasiliensis TaxID=930266 RepID=UPI003B839E8C
MWQLGCLGLLLLLLIGEGARARSGGKKRESGVIVSTRTGNWSIFEGRFTAQDGSRCTWTANGEKTFFLRVACEPKRRTHALGRFSCQYVGEPAACASYSGGARRYWRQVARALAKQTQLCADERAVLRVGMCAHAPPAAHFRLERPKKEEAVAKTTTTVKTTVELLGSSAAPECTGSADHRKLAEEKCGETWASFCRFMFTIVQSEGDC